MGKKKKKSKSPVPDRITITLDLHKMGDPLSEYGKIGLGLDEASMFVQDKAGRSTGYVICCVGAGVEVFHRRTGTRWGINPRELWDSFKQALNESTTPAIRKRLQKAKHKRRNS